MEPPLTTCCTVSCAVATDIKGDEKRNNGAAEQSIKKENLLVGNKRNGINEHKRAKVLAVRLPCINLPPDCFVIYDTAIALLIASS
jgi:hypothetical protein